MAKQLNILLIVLLIHYSIAVNLKTSKAQKLQEQQVIQADPLELEETFPQVLLEVDSLISEPYEKRYYKDDDDDDEEDDEDEDDDQYQYDYELVLKNQDNIPDVVKPEVPIEKPSSGSSFGIGTPVAKEYDCK